MLLPPAVQDKTLLDRAALAFRETTSPVHRARKAEVQRLTEANKALEADPGLINREPYGQGWIFVLKIENPDDLKNLKDASAYKKHIG